MPHWYAEIADSDVGDEKCRRTHELMAWTARAVKEEVPCSTQVRWIVPKEPREGSQGVSWAWGNFEHTKEFELDAPVAGFCDSPDAIAVVWGMSDRDEAEVIVHETLHMTRKRQRGWRGFDAEEVTAEFGQRISGEYLSADEGERLRVYSDWLVDPARWARKDNTESEPQATTRHRRGARATTRGQGPRASRMP